MYVYKYLSLTVNQYYRPKVYVLLYEWDVHVTLVKAELCTKQRFWREATVRRMILAGQCDKIHCISIFNWWCHIPCVLQDLIPALHAHHHFFFAPWNDPYHKLLEHQISVIFYTCHNVLVFCMLSTHKLWGLIFYGFDNYQPMIRLVPAVTTSIFLYTCKSLTLSLNADLIRIVNDSKQWKSIWYGHVSRASGLAKS